MSEVINGVPRELLERSAQMIQFYVEYLCATNSEESDIELAGECVDELRALLTAQPQASAAQSAPIDVFEEGQWWLVELDSIVANGTPDQKRAMAVVRNLLSSWQRTQSAPVVPEGWSKSLGSCWPSDEDYPQGDWSIGTVDEDGNRYEVVRVEASQYDAEGESQKIAEAIVRLWGSAAPQPAARQEQGDEVQRLREALEEERDALRAELEAARKQEPAHWWRDGVDGVEYCQKPFTNDWHPLYALPPLAGQVSVPRELLERVAYLMEFGELDGPSVRELRALLATPSMEVKHEG